MTKNFIEGEHYTHGFSDRRIYISHSHWHTEEPCEVWNQSGVTSLLRIRTVSSGNGVSADICCSLSVDQLRELAGALNDAADSLAAHQRQIGGAA